MSKRNQIEHDFSPVIFASRGVDGDETYKLFHNTAADAIESDEVDVEGHDDNVALVATYKLVKVQRLKLVKEARVVTA